MVDIPCQVGNPITCECHRVTGSRWVEYHVIIDSRVAFKEGICDCFQEAT